MKEAWLPLATFVLLNACGAGESPRSTMLREILASDDVTRARTHAPDLVAAAERAEADAQANSRRANAAAADDDATRARLYIAAALAETERAEADEARLALVRETDTLAQEALALETERLEIERESARLAASRAAGEELARALRQAEADEPRRRNLVSSGARGGAGVAVALVRRARLDLAIALSLAPPTRDSDEAVALLARWDAMAEQDAQRLHVAEDVRLATERALGRARASTEHPSAEAIASLVRAAEEYQFVISVTPRGAVIDIASDTATTQARLADLLLAFPTGPVLIDASGAPRRFDLVRDTLVRRGVPATRVQSANVGSSARSGGLGVVLPGYAPTAAN